MIKCLECSTENLDGALFCENCGAELTVTDFSESDQVADGFDSIGEATLKLVVASTGDEIVVPEKDQVIVGREDPVDSVFPDIDTTGFGGEDDGVSRQHAKIIRDGGSYLVEDMNSVNSTFINKSKVEPGSPSLLKDGDELMLGRLKFNVVMGL